MINDFEKLMSVLNKPQDSLRFIHIAGTNGKGSTCAMVASCLTEAGYKTGLYTSPHLVRENERIKINNIEISNTDLERLAKKVDSYTEFNINFFERFTAIAFLYFEEQKCDYVVLEVGLGGRLDATNIIKKSEVSAITNLGLEHTEILGDTIEKIAFEKAGIIKENGRVILYPSEEKAVNVAKDIAKKKNATIKMVDFQKTIPTNLYGEYQKRNAATAVAILKELNIPLDIIKAGLQKVYWPGRFEKLNNNPTVFVDGAHNPNGILNILDSIPNNNITFLFGALKEKDVLAEIEMLIPFAKRFITITPPTTRALNSSDLAKMIESKTNKPVYDAKNPVDGIMIAMNLCTKDDIIIALGSLYQVGEIRKCFGKE